MPAAPLARRSAPPFPAGKYHDALVKDIRGRTSAYASWNVLGEWFGYIHNQLYAPLFPGNLALGKGAAGKGAEGHAESNGPSGIVANGTANLVGR